MFLTVQPLGIRPPTTDPSRSVPISPDQSRSVSAPLFIAKLALIRLTGARTGYTTPADYLGLTVALVAFLAVVVVIVTLGGVRSRTERLRRLTLVGAGWPGSVMSGSRP